MAVCCRPSLVIRSYVFFPQVFIGVSSSLIVFPMSVIILYIFRNVRPKPVKPRHQSEISLNPLTNLRADPLLTSSNETHVRTASGPVEAGQIHTYYDARNSQVLEKAKVQNKKGKKMAHRSKLKDLIPRLPSSLPYWFVYFAWFLLVILTLGSATVVILYGMQFGNGRSLQWLFSNVVSICEDILVVQPLKVLALALVFALLVKKPDEGEFRASGAESLQDDEELLVNSPSDSASEHKSRCAASPELLQRPDEGQLRLMREARLKERKMFGLIHEIIVHLLFTIIVALITYGHKDSRSISLFQNLDELRTTTKEVNL